MNTLDAISGRRSIRKFKPDAISEENLKTILRAGIEAPSGKNRQPWKFIVVGDDKRDEMLAIIRRGIKGVEEKGEDAGSSKWTANVMEQAPVTVFVFNPFGIKPWISHSVDQNFEELVNVQSVGAAIQNMLLSAFDLGIGSLWICDVFYAYEDLCNWLGEKDQMVAAVSFGYPDEAPDARPRKAFSEVVHFL